MYYSTKFYDHNEGLSGCFRQWRAKSHCRLLHGYSLAFRFTFACRTLDYNNWCVDFGSLKPLREWLHDNFDHKLIVADDDPAKGYLISLGTLELADVMIVSDVSCESFAKMAFDKAASLVNNGRVWIESCEVSEHSGNLGSYSVYQS